VSLGKIASLLGLMAHDWDHDRPEFFAVCKSRLDMLAVEDGET
jgi:hypothetical protein